MAQLFEIDPLDEYSVVKESHHIADGRGAAGMQEHIEGKDGQQGNKPDAFERMFALPQGQQGESPAIAGNIQPRKPQGEPPEFLGGFRVISEYPVHKGDVKTHKEGAYACKADEVAV